MMVMKNNNPFMSLLINDDFRSRSRHMKIFTTDTTPCMVPRIKIFV